MEMWFDGMPLHQTGPTYKLSELPPAKLGFYGPMPMDISGYVQAGLDEAEQFANERDAD